VHGRVRRNDASQITDGGAGTVLAGRTYAESWAVRHGIDLDTVPRILGWGHRTVGLGFEDKVRRDAGATYLFPHVRQAAVDAQTRAGLSGTDEIDCFEVHDCFTATGYLLVDHLGLTEPGEARQLIESGDLERTGRRPLNPGGGLMGQGHPVGATGVRMVLDARKQITGTAGDVQVDDVRRVATLNIGGSTASSVSFVVGAP
jgi:acetyl-CoA C-acetyltransferase